MVIDAGAVPGVDDFVTFGRGVAKLGNGEAFDEGEVVFAFFAVFGGAHVEVADVVAA